MREIYVESIKKSDGKPYEVRASRTVWEQIVYGNIGYRVSYEYSDFSSKTNSSLQFDSYMVAEEDLEKGDLRLLEVDNSVVLPTEAHIRVLITSSDVLHSWAVPSLGVKMDACPGRLNQVSLFIKRESTFYGQCSEICGANHAFMPIKIEGVSIEKYITWLLIQTEGNSLILAPSK